MRMSLRFPLLAAIALCGALLVPAGPAVSEPGSWVEAPKKLPRVQRGDRTNNLDFLFGALKVAPDETSAKSIEERIWALVARVQERHHQSPDDAREDRDGRRGSRSRDQAARLRSSRSSPDYTEAWNRRATAYYMKKEFNRSLADIRQVLAREPRHFGALAGLGLIMQDLGDDKRALEIYRKALAIHPRLPRVPDLIKTLTEKVEGRDI